jgi:hypothetical protein
MRKVSLVRVAGVVTAFIVASFISFPSFPSTTVFTVPPTSVDRTFKSDRLPLAAPTSAPGAPIESTSTDQSQTPVREKVPLGCESAFSPISAPRLAHVFGRCAV